MKRLILIISVVGVASTLIFLSIFLPGLLYKPPAEEGQPSPLLDQIKVEFVDSTYKVASGKTSGWFTTEQEADILLSGFGFNNAGGPLLFNHPKGIASDGTRLILADTYNNRILIWNKLPTNNSVPPSLVLGQKNFTANNPGSGLDGLNWPVGVATDGEHLLVADTYNDRILIWNSFPTVNGQPADLVLSRMEGPRDQRGNIVWPWAVWTNGEKVVVTSTGIGQVLIWNSFPTVNNQPPDIVLGLEGKFGTPRSIGSDGQRLVIGDHNALGTQGNFFWRSFPTYDDQMYDFFIASPELIGKEQTSTTDESSITPGEVIWSTFTPDGKFLALGIQLYIWNTFPQDEKDPPDLILGARAPSDKGFWFEGAEGSSITVAGNRVYLSLSNGNKIVGFFTLPSSPEQWPDFAVGSPDVSTNTLETNFIITNPAPASDGKSLFVSSDYDSKLYVWKNLPDESGAKPDIVYSLPEGSWDNTLFNGVLVLAGHRTVYVWKKLPLEGNLPDLIFHESIGSITFQQLTGVALDDKYFYLADVGANKIYVWEGIPTQNTNPKFSLTVNQPWRLSSDGQYLAVTCTIDPNGGSVKLYPIESLSSTANPTVLGGQGKFNLPQQVLVSHGHLFIADTGFNRILIWSSIQDALAGKDPDVTLGALTDLTRPEIGKNKLFWPAVVSFDGSYLWIGEFKFSNRLLRFSPK